MLRSVVTSLSDPKMINYMETMKRANNSITRISNEIEEIKNIIKKLDHSENQKTIEILERKIKDREEFKKDIYRYIARRASHKPMYAGRTR